MLHLVLLAAAATAVQPIVSTEWLAVHLKDPNVRVVDCSGKGAYERAHIDGAVNVDHMDVVDSNHRPLAGDLMAKAWAKVGVGDHTHVVLYGDSPMATGWAFMMLNTISHGEQVSMLDGGLKLWEQEKRPVTNTTPAVAAATLTPRPTPDTIVDAAWVRERLESPTIKLLDVRTTQEWNNGRLPNATLILWQDLYADRETLKFKSPQEIKALIERTGWKPDQEVVTYCLVGMRASLMYFAAKAAGVPVRVYLGSWQDWSKDSRNPIVR
jgi:thiosulfate/3-mercaptopyruvate sulfurtransferase